MTRKRPPQRDLEAMQPALSRPSYVPAQDPLELPARVAQQGQVMPMTPTVLNATAVNASTSSRSFTSIQGRPQDATYSLLIRTAAVVVIVGVTLGALAIVGLVKAMLGYPEAIAGWVVLTGVSALLAMYGFHRQDMKHSPAGESMHGATEARRTATETMAIQADAWATVELERWRLHYGTIERQIERDHAERTALIEARREAAH